MILRAIFISLAFCLPTSAIAKTVEAPDIRAVQTDSTDIFQVLTQLREAEAALLRRDYTSARQGFEAALMHDPQLETARAGLSRTLIALGDIPAAAKWNDDPNSADGVIINVLMNDIADPKTVLKTALQTTADPRLWTLLGRLQDDAEEFSSARQAYAMAGLAGARPGLANNNIGQSHWLADNKKAALEAFNAAVKADPLDKQFDNNRRRALIALGRTHEAIAGLDAERAGLFLAKAADKAVLENEVKLAKYLYKKSLDLSPRHNPNVAAKLVLLEGRR